MRKTEGEKGDNYKRKGSIQSVTTPRPSMLHSSQLARNVSTRSAPNREEAVWIRSRLSIYSDCSGTSGYGSVSTNQSQLDLAIQQMTPPTERSSQLSFMTRSNPSSMRGKRLPFKSNLQRDIIKDEAMPAGRGASIGRNMSWSNIRTIKKE